jgi:hypothetical protein
MRCLLLLCLLVVAESAIAAVVIDFEELSLPPNSYFDGYGENAASGSWSSRGAQFNTNPWGPGWSYSNIDNATTPGHLNSYAAYTGTGFGGSGIYALGTSFVPNSAYINLPTNHFAHSLRVTNATYAAISMRDGDRFAKKFGGDTGDDEDFFRLLVTGFTGQGANGNAVGQVELMLADFRFANNAEDYILDQWALLDLTSLQLARSLAFTLESSDNGGFGMNTPAFFAIDHLTLTAVPEPSFTVVLATASAAIAVVRRRLRCQVVA